MYFPHMSFLIGHISSLLDTKNRDFSNLHLSMEPSLPPFDIVHEILNTVSIQNNINIYELYVETINIFCKHYNVSFDFESLFSDNKLTIDECTETIYNVLCRNQTSDIVNFLVEYIKNEVLHGNILAEFGDSLSNYSDEKYVMLTVSERYIIPILQLISTRFIPFSEYLRLNGYGNRINMVFDYFNELDESYVNQVFSLLQSDRYHVNIITAIKCNIYERYRDINDSQFIEVPEETNNTTI